jgi:unsaturated rhamnogalacturonyl hydrolase
MKKSISNPFVFIIILFSILSCRQDARQSRWDDTQAMVKAMQWQEQHPVYALAPTDWTNGAYYIGVTKAYQATQNPLFLAAIKTMGYRNEWKPYKRTYHADDIAISYPYLFVSTTRNELVDLEPTKSWIDTHLFESNEWKDGTNPQKNILWWWCDALFMAPPVIAYYSMLTDEQKYLDAMHQYYIESYGLLFDKEESLFARDVRFIINGSNKDLKEENGEKIFWSRGNGWVLGGLVLILELLPKDYEHYSFYTELYKTMAQRIKEIQPEDGLWRVSLLNPEGYEHGEVSGSGFFTYALAWGINNGLLNEQEYKPVVMKAWKALRECQHDDGMVGWVQNIGDSPKPADKNSWQNYGTGAFLLAGSEIIKLNQ